MTTNNTCKKCGCQDSFMPSPAPCPTPIGCPTPQPCSEVTDSQCVIYTGSTLSCDGNVIIAANNNVAQAFNNIIGYICANQPVSDYIYEIGQYVEDEGGVIFHRYIDDGVQNYLVVDIVDLSVASFWSNIDNVAIGLSAQSTWEGENNSNSIIGQSGFSSGAAKACLDSTNNGQNDWYLPAVDELSLLWQNRFNVNKTLSGNSSFATIPGATQILYNNYWSSTETDGLYAWVFYFDVGSANGYNLKSDTRYVRAVRNFSI